MRVSADKDDPGYLPWHALGNLASKVKVYLDDVLIEKAITADDVAGTVEVYATGSDNQILIRDGEAVRCVLTGQVRIVIPQAMSENDGVEGE